MDRPIKVKRSKCPKNTKVIVRQQNMITITENLFLRNKFEIKNKDMEKSYCFQNWNIAKLLKITKNSFSSLFKFWQNLSPATFREFCSSTNCIWNICRTLSCKMERKKRGRLCASWRNPGSQSSSALQINPDKCQGNSAPVRSSLLRLDRLGQRGSHICSRRWSTS